LHIFRLQRGRNGLFDLKILELTFSELLNTLEAEYGKGKYHACGIYREVFQNGNLSLINTVDFLHSQPFARKITSTLEINPGKVIKKKKDGGVTKFITRLHDDHEIESVVIPMATHNTICVSSQVGCKIGCQFCQTGQLGFIRNLTTEEIVGQVYSTKFKLGIGVRNIVFMGMGEPFDNFDNVIQAVRVFNDQRGLNVALRYITISTVGKNAEIQKLANLGLKGIRLAVSLNAPNDRVRALIMPPRKMSSMKTLQDTLIQYPLSKKETIFITYVLIKDINDTYEHAVELAEYVKPLSVKINVIPYNLRSASPFESPSEEEVQQFCNWLVEFGVFIRKRRTKGQDMMAACGQLGKIKSIHQS
jgi:23S rRNA (adenine2503-C2)-methyltransferase